MNKTKSFSPQSRKERKERKEDIISAKAQYAKQWS
jgi:hypothetical protein